MDWSSYPEEDKKALIQAWNDWRDMLGSTRVGGGAVKFGGKSATKNGTQDADNLTTGFAIVEVDSMDEALKYAAQAPMVVDGTGSLDVYEMLEF